MKKIISLVLVLMLTTLICVPSTFASSVGPWIADLSQDISGTGTKLSHNGCFLNMQNSGSEWTYDEVGDYANTNGREAHLYVSDKYAADYTIGFKMCTPTSGKCSLMIKFDTLADESTKTKTSSEIARPEEPKFSKAIVLWPDGNRNTLISYKTEDSSMGFYNSEETEEGQKKSTSFETVPIGSWADIKFEIDCIEDESSALAYAVKGYLNGELISTMEYPKELKAYYYNSSGNDYYWAKLVSPDVFQIKTAAGTKIKDMYMQNGISSESLVPEAVTDSIKLVKDSYTDNKFDIKNGESSTAANDSHGSSTSYNKWNNGIFAIDTMGAQWKVDGIATITFTSGTDALTPKDKADLTKGYEYPRLSVGTAQAVGGKFIWRAKFRANDFAVNKTVIQFNAGNWLSNLLSIPTSEGTTGVLQLNNKSTVVDSCEISADKWYSVEVIGTRNSGKNRMAYDVTVCDVATGDVVIDNYIGEDNNALAKDDKVRWQIKYNNGNDLMNLPEGTTTSFSVDDIHFASYYEIPCMEADALSLIQGDNLVIDAYDVASPLKVSALVSNNTASVKDACLIAAEYDQFDELLNVDFVEKEILAGTVTEKSAIPFSEVFYLNITPSDDSSKIKLFIVDSIGNLRPISKSVNVNAAVVAQ